MEPSEEIVSEPLGLPTTVGLNFTLIFALCPGFNVTGRDKPLTEKPAPVEAAEEIVTLDPPVLVSVSETVWLVPTTTVPKLIEDGVEVTAPSVTPVPAKGIARLGFDPSDVIVKVPASLPAADGLYLTLKFVL